MVKSPPKNRMFSYFASRLEVFVSVVCLALVLPIVVGLFLNITSYIYYLAVGITWFSIVFNSVRYMERFGYEVKNRT